MIRAKVGMLIIFQICSISFCMVTTLAFFFAGLSNTGSFPINRLQTPIKRLRHQRDILNPCYSHAGMISEHKVALPLMHPIHAHLTAATMKNVSRHPGMPPNSSSPAQQTDFMTPGCATASHACHVYKGISDQEAH